MACPVCGKPSPCAHEPQRAAVLVGPAIRQATEPGSSSSPTAANTSEILDRSHATIWRQEVVSRVRQHRARRRRRVDADATMELDFQSVTDSCSVQGQAAGPRASRAEPPKIIEFPRPAASSGLQPIRLDGLDEHELAEPVVESPRILETPEPVAEQLELLPAFADIQLKEEESRTSESLELPPPVAPLTPRIFAGLVDMIVVLIAGALFAIGFVTFANGLPQLRLMLLCGLVVCGSFWLMYQYLFLVYLSATPGMQLAQLELCTFRTRPVSLTLRRWRALASMLSALALGLGFAWAMVDEDNLGWHDRMTQTCLKKIE